MRDDTPSRTAAWVAAARQLGQLLPDDVRLVDDPYGAAFTSPALGRWIARAERVPIAGVPGLRSWVVYMQVRTRVIDDAIRAFAASGGRQLVVLGAGYDCRALRLGELGLAVYEIDHPATQAHKQRVLAKLEARSPASYVTWDFEARPLDELPEALAEAGHHIGEPSFTIWEGVTMYLSEPAIDASLRAIAAWSAEDSVLAMTYFAKQRIERPSLVTRAIAAVVSGAGEPWRWGWNPDDLPDYLAERGFELDVDISLADAAAELLPESLARLVRDGDRRVAFARAAPESIAFASARGGDYQ